MQATTTGNKTVDLILMRRDIKIFIDQCRVIGVIGCEFTGI